MDESYDETNPVHRFSDEPPPRYPECRNGIYIAAAILFLVILGVANYNEQPKWDFERLHTCNELGKQVGAGYWDGAEAFN